LRKNLKYKNAALAVFLFPTYNSITRFFYIQVIFKAKALKIIFNK